MSRRRARPRGQWAAMAMAEREPRGWETETRAHRTTLVMKGHAWPSIDAETPWPHTPCTHRLETKTLSCVGATLPVFPPNAGGRRRALSTVATRRRGARRAAPLRAGGAYRPGHTSPPSAGRAPTPRSRTWARLSVAAGVCRGTQKRGDGAQRRWGSKCKEDHNHGGKKEKETEPRPGGRVAVSLPVKRGSDVAVSTAAVAAGGIGMSSMMPPMEAARPRAMHSSPLPRGQFSDAVRAVPTRGLGTGTLCIADPPPGTAACMYVDSEATRPPVSKISMDRVGPLFTCLRAIPVDSLPAGRPGLRPLRDGYTWTNQQVRNSKAGVTPNGGCTVDGHRRSVFWMPEAYPKNHRTSLLPDTHRGRTLSRALPFLCCAHSHRGWRLRRDEPRTAGSSRDDPAHVNGLPAAPWSGWGKTRAPGHVPPCGCNGGADGSFAGCRWRQLRGVARRPPGPAPASWPHPYDELPSYPSRAAPAPAAQWVHAHAHGGCDKAPHAWTHAHFRGLTHQRPTPPPAQTFSAISGASPHHRTG